VRLPLAFVNQHLKLGYAATIHKGQGATSDQALLLVTDGVELEAAYTGASRGRTENHLYVCRHDLNRLAHQLSQSAAKDLASENDRRR
jgi:ATP-dependent exoDNAse (exonuclease V) alpha subunit